VVNIQRGVLLELMKDIMSTLRKVFNRFKAIWSMFLLGMLPKYTVNICLRENNTN
jgi:hypothetical protein